MRVIKTISDRLPPRLRVPIAQAMANVSDRLGTQSKPALVREVLLREHLKRPTEMDIEVTSACDADCIMCPRKTIRRRVGPMDFELFKSIIDEVVDLDIPRIHLNGYGEISVLPGYRKYLAYIRERSSSIQIGINSNGMRMHEDLIRAYIEYQIDSVNVTIDGATAETYENIRKKLKLDQVERNVLRLVELRNQAGKNRPAVRVGMIHMPQNSHETEIFLRKWKGKVDYVGISGLVSRTGSIDFVQIEDRNWTATPCWHLWNQVVIFNDGSYGLCCDDWDASAGLGNFRQTSIRDLWTNRERAAMRRLHVSGKADEIPACAACRQPRSGPWWFQNSFGKRHETAAGAPDRNIS